ncbi:MAG TPA: hypothetical protein VM031_05110 [Phycisphaerae bacterium]|nr:hypothetical protein [Phycisphaerae bacterium]
MPSTAGGRRVAWALCAAGLAAAAAVGVWLLVQRGGDAATSLLRYAPPGSTIVAWLDVGKLRRSELYRQMRETLAPAERQLARDLRGLRLTFDDIEGALVAGTADAGVIVLATGRAMSLEEVLAAPERAQRHDVEGYPVVSTAGARGQWVARLGDRLFCVAEHEEALREVLRRARAGERPKVDAELDELLAPLRRHEHFIGVGGIAGSLGRLEWLLPAPVVSELASVRAVGVGFSVGTCIELDVRARLAHADQAMRLCGEVQKAVREGIAKAESAKPGLDGQKLESAERMLDFLKSVAASQADTLACLRARLDEKATDALVAPLAAGVARAQGQAQVAANVSNLRQIALGCIAYETGKRAWPKSLAEVVDAGFLTKDLLVSPLDREPPLLAPGVPCSYASSLERLGERGRLPAIGGHLPLAWDRVAFVPGMRCVAFLDGRVERVPEERFATLLRHLEAAIAGASRPSHSFPRLPLAKGEDGELVGGPGGVPFRLVGPPGAPMLGVRCVARRWMREDCLAAVEPLFAAAPAGPTVALAKPGYAVGAVEVDAALQMNAIQLVFMRWDGVRLNPGDSYRSAWLGKPTGRPTRLLDGKGAKVVGLCGRRALVVKALGLVTEGDAGP